MDNDGTGEDGPKWYNEKTTITRDVTDEIHCFMGGCVRKAKNIRT